MPPQALVINALSIVNKVCTIILPVQNTSLHASSPSSSSSSSPTSSSSSPAPLLALEAAPVVQKFHVVFHPLRHRGVAQIQTEDVPVYRHFRQAVSRRVLSRSTRRLGVASPATHSLSSVFGVASRSRFCVVDVRVVVVGVGAGDCAVAGLIEPVPDGKRDGLEGWPVVIDNTEIMSLTELNDIIDNTEIMSLTELNDIIDNTEIMSLTELNDIIDNTEVM